ncbi:MAG: HAD family hydrolase [Chitinophagaceae bacterium]|nr:HAD family hydrolase [Chitinophagaceae bacterium]MCW5904419.1 HAD family hydrolase [Chitinophagaceae bacterium]
MLNLKSINPSWTLFLDRDGVINHEKDGSYIFNWQEFHFYDGVKEALHILNKHFDTIVMVTNQRGVGKKLMTENDLNNIHQNMLEEINKAGGRIDKIYYCSDIENTSPNRKPNHGMALQAKKDFAAIDFSKSIMVGNKLSDMQFGRNAGMHTVFVATTHPEIPFPHEAIDARFNDLWAFAKAINKQ